LDEKGEEKKRSKEKKRKKERSRRGRRRILRCRRAKGGAQEEESTLRSLHGVNPACTGSPQHQDRHPQARQVSHRCAVVPNPRLVVRPPYATDEPS